MDEANSVLQSQSTAASKDADAAGAGVAGKDAARRSEAGWPEDGVARLAVGGGGFARADDAAERAAGRRTALAAGGADGGGAVGERPARLAIAGVDVCAAAPGRGDSAARQTELRVTAGQSAAAGSAAALQSGHAAAFGAVAVAGAIEIAAAGKRVVVAGHARGRHLLAHRGSAHAGLPVGAVGAQARGARRRRRAAVAAGAGLVAAAEAAGALNAEAAAGAHRPLAEKDAGGGEIVGEQIGARDVAVGPDAGLYLRRCLTGRRRRAVGVAGVGEARLAGRQIAVDARQDRAVAAAHLARAAHLGQIAARQIPRRRKAAADGSDERHGAQRAHAHCPTNRPSPLVPAKTMPEVVTASARTSRLARPSLILLQLSAPSSERKTPPPSVPA